ncbi:hypothetical protein DQ04_06191010 [Trypanosoma grayi]|uniref:hypothetical protein n=1 Tax=Trypanosoma grayi TaxID=71804 RepID=UPI0004F3F696|nr:hypothetical protein DQ04_06191010 [Trypanosoma grayi]KEG08912.1 hypothetical protein DQ04_06191010 [Trypanosoma grayi]
MGFSTGICDCCGDLGTLLDVFFCFPCNVSRQWNAVHGDYDSCSCLYCLATDCFPCLSLCCLRQTVSSKFALGEGLCEVCLCSCFCALCAACQIHRELTMRGAPPGGCCCKPSTTPMR